VTRTRYFVIVAAHDVTELHDHVDGKHGRVGKSVLFAEPAALGMVYGVVEFEAARRAGARRVKEGDQISVMLDGHVRRAHVRAINGKWVLLHVIGWGAEDQMLALDDEGTRWAPGWDEETQGALRAANTLLDERRLNGPSN
jgi:hypothetical protein